jgi:hypothetical protein
MNWHEGTGVTTLPTPVNLSRFNPLRVHFGAVPTNAIQGGPMSSRLSKAGLLCTLFIVLLLTNLSSAANHEQEFSGYFDVSGVQEQGDLVQVTLHLKLFNHSDADAKSVIVTLLDSSAAMTLRGNFQPVKVWKSQQFIEMSQEFSISQREFKQWMSPPAQPNIVILFQDGNRRSWQKGAQISRHPLMSRAQ